MLPETQTGRRHIRRVRGRVTISRLKASIKDTNSRDPRMWGEQQYETEEHEFPYGEVLDTLLTGFYENFGQAVAGKPA
jgi:hypothetical protein